MRHALYLLALLSAIAPSPVYAAAAWTIVPGESRVNLAGELDGQPTEVDVTGLAGDIVFDPADLTASHIKIVIDLATISAGYKWIEDQLAGAGWFDVAKFPSAVFISDAITKRPDGRYSAAGTLALRGVTKPVTLVFNVENRSGSAGKSNVPRAIAKGEAAIDRRAFTIGTDKWDTHVADDVRVTFTVVADRPAGP